MFCSKCGREIKEGTMFCVYCGEQVSAAPDITVLGNDTPVNAVKTKQKGQKQNKKSKKPLLIGSGVAVAAVFGFFVGGSLICDNRESALAKSIEDYAISDYAQQNESLQSDYQEESFLNVFGKIKVVRDLSDLQKQSKKADEELKNHQKSLDDMEANKGAYDLADSYADYEKSLSSCRKAIEKREYEKATNAFSEAQDNLEQLNEDNKTFVEKKLDFYGTADWSDADVSEKSIYDEDVEKINTLLKAEKFSEMKTVFEEMDDIAFMYIEPDYPLYVSVQQVDATDYPYMKLYVQLEDSTGDVPENLESNFFYVRKKDANASYVRQKVAQVTQLNELEALNIDMVADVSGSMDGYPLEEAKSLMSDFIGTVQFDVGDRVELTSFSTGVYLQQEFTDDAANLRRRIEGLYTDDMTSLYDALYTSVTRTASQNGAKCVIAFTDGADNYSNCSAQDVINTAKRYSVPIFIIGVGYVNDYDIRDIAASTGGAYYSVDEIGSIREIYDQIYKQEKELYMIEYKDETGASISDTSNIIVGYHSQEYGGEEKYAYTPNILMSVKGSALYANGPEAVVEGYMRAFDDAMTESDFSYIEDYLKKDSNIYKTQKKYVEKDFAEQLESYEIADIEYKDNKHCVITTCETYFVQKEGESLDLLTQQCKYKLACVNGEWKMTDFAGNVEVLSRIKQ